MQRALTPRRSLSRRLVGRLGLLALAVTVVAVSPAQGGPSVDGFPGGPYFAIVCGFSHRNNDDPIRYPGQPGRSHNHTYVGNRTVDASTTAASLLDGPTTCDAGERDSSTYWVPTLYVDREPVPPLVGIVYYTRHFSEAVSATPVGLKMVAGNPAARRPQRTSIASWGCGGIGSTRRFPVARACGRDDSLELEVLFPNCWNGKALDSPDHKRHLAYASAGRCPASHPVRLPTITLVLLYPPVTGRVQTSAGKFAAHADFINGWEQGALERLVSGLNAPGR